MATLYGTGVFSEDLVTALKEIRTDWNAVLTKLDTDTGVSGENYNSLWAIAEIGIIDNETGGAIDQASVVSRLQAAITSIAGVNAKLDAESLGYSDYASKYNVTDNINVNGGDIWDAGAFQGDVVKKLYELKTNINLIEKYLDADSVVNLETYYSGNPIAFDIDATGC